MNNKIVFGTQPHIWHTSNTRVWIIQKDIKTLVLCGMSSVNFINDLKGGWYCGYCGSANESLNCEKCDAPRKARRRKGSLLLFGALPLCQILDQLYDDFLIEVQHGICCDPRVHDPEKTILIASNCKINAKWIDDMIAAKPDDVCPVMLNLDIKCDISLRFP
jgi:hypothetical protein